MLRQADKCVPVRYTTTEARNCAPIALTPLTIFACVHRFQEEDPAFRGRSLQVNWTAPIVDEDYGDFFGDGGSTIPVSVHCGMCVGISTCVFGLRCD